MSQQKAFDQALEALSEIIAKELKEARDTIRRLSEEHTLKLGELRGLREQYRRQMLAAIRAEVSAARAIDRTTIDELRAEIDALRRQRASEYSR